MAALARSRTQSTPLLTGLTALAPLTWGTTYAVTSQLLPSGYPVMSTVLRALPAGLVLLACTRELPRGGWLLRAVVLGALNIALFNTLLFVSAYRLPGGVAATLNSTQPLFAAAFAFLLLGERSGRWRLVWGAAGVGGVALMVLRAGASLDRWGVLAGLCAAVVMSAGVVLTKRWGRPSNVGPATLAAWQLTAGGLLLAPFGLALEGWPPMTGRAVAGYLWIGVAGALVAYVVWFNGIGKLPVTAVSFLTLLSPVMATLLGWLVLDQALTLWQGVGFLLALTATFAAQVTPSPTSSRTSHSPRSSTEGK